MNKLLIALGLATTVALVGCSKEEAPETGATTGEHLENAANQPCQFSKNHWRCQVDSCADFKDSFR